MASLLLHQACESYIYAIRLVFTLENPKQHNLTKLLNSVKRYSDEFIKVFPQDTPKEKRLFELIKAAYVNGRYDPDFVVTKEDIDALVPKVELLRCSSGSHGEEIRRLEKIPEEKILLFFEDRACLSCRIFASQEEF